MDNFRAYGKAPYSVVVVHGGPGANGEMTAVAKKLSFDAGVLEPLQTAMSVDGQIQELKETLETHANFPVTLIGHSWGAWLVYFFAARHPSLVKKIILVASAPFRAEDDEIADQVRLNRLNEKERSDMKRLWKELSENNGADQKIVKDFLSLLTKADAFSPLADDEEEIDFHFDIFQCVWPEAAALRKSGELLDLGKNITCPVVAIHGDYDPHPAGGVEEPLSKIIKDFHFILLKNCGHRPWAEKKAKEEFHRVLENALRLKS